MTDTTAHQTHAVGRERLLGHLAMIGFAALIAGSFSFGRLALPYVDPGPLNAARYLVATAIMGGFVFGIRGHKFELPKAPWRFAILGGLMGFYFISMFIALTMTKPVSTSAVFTLMPLMTAVFGFLLLSQRVGPILIVSLLFAACGSVWVIFGGSLDAILSFDIGQGELLYLAGCVGHAIFTPLLRRFDRGESPFFVTFYILVGTGFWIALYGFPGILTTDWAALPLIAWLAILYLATFTGFVTFMLMQYASLRLPAAKVMSYGYLVPCFVILYEGLMGNGWASLSVLAGALVTGLGLFVLYLTPDK